MALEHPIDALPAGTRLGSYEILRVLGRGGFGVTWSGEAVADIARPVAQDGRARDKFNRCVMLEFDAEKHKWRDVLRRTPRAAAAASARRTPARGLSQSQQSHPSPQPYRDGYRASSSAREPAWVPLVTGLVLLALPPVGVAMVWSSRRYDATAKLALTIFSGFTMCLAAIVTIFALL